MRKYGLSLVVLFFSCYVNAKISVSFSGEITKEDTQPVVITIELPQAEKPESQVVTHSVDSDPDFNFQALLADEKTKDATGIEVTNIEETSQNIVVTLAAKNRVFSGCSIIESPDGEVSIVVAKEQ